MTGTYIVVRFFWTSFSDSEGPSIVTELGISSRATSSTDLSCNSQATRSARRAISNLNSWVMWFCDALSPLGVVVAGSHVIVELLWAQLSNSEGFCVVSKLLRRAVLTWTKSTKLTGKSKALWSAWRFTADMNLYDTRLSQRLSSFR